MKTITLIALSIIYSISSFIFTIAISLLITDYIFNLPIDYFVYISIIIMSIILSFSMLYILNDIAIWNEWDNNVTWKFRGVLYFLKGTPITCSKCHKNILKFTKDIYTNDHLKAEQFELQPKYVIKCKPPKDGDTACCPYCMTEFLSIIPDGGPQRAILKVK